MKLLLLLVTTLCFAIALSAQPVNDDCDGLIGLGNLPACPDDIFTNVGATATDIGFGNIPTCFNGGTASRDVWFSFTTTNEITDVSIALQGTNEGPNGSIVNPEINLYRGDCAFNGLADLGACVSAPAGFSSVQLDVLNLTPNTTYFIRINDYSASASPNSGDFRLCLEEYVPAINMGESSSSTACFGTLFDSGGPDEDYQNGENLTFTIAPGTPFECLEIQIVNFQTENNFDFLSVYAGPDTGAPLIGRYTGNSTSPITILASSASVTVEFTSDASAVAPGFELTWSCSALPCGGSSISNPTAISGLPFQQDGYSSCGAAATFAESPCGNTPFLNGPEYVFAYTSNGGFCAQVEITGADMGTGLLILDGPPGQPGTTCVGSSPTGMVAGANFETPGTYYIVVANATGCTDFGLSITETECRLAPSLLNALCNPLNGCISPDNLPSVFSFNQGFEDIAFNPGVNDGCWFNTGSAQPNYYWFTIEAQAEGPFGFTLEAANLPEEASDIDFQVWGPFNPDEVCDNPQSIVDFVENNQPIRSSYAGGADPTGLASIHPVTGLEVLDEYDCFPDPNGNVDDFARVIDCQPGEVYAVLFNDWGNNIQSGAVSIDWAASDPAVLAPTPVAAITSDTAICLGESVQLLIESSVGNITWLKDTTTLSCIDCFDPIATPTETTNYVAIIDAVCYQDTVEILVQVYDVAAGPDLSVCRNEEIQIVAGSNFLNATYEWTAPPGVSLSCTDCPAPFVTAEDTGIYPITVTLITPNCVLEDQMVLTVLDGEAPLYSIGEDVEICQGESVDIGGPAEPGSAYEWSSVPEGFSATVANPTVMPDTTTRYYLSITGDDCPVPSFDSVLVTVFLPPVLSIAGDTAICQSDTLMLGNMAVEAGVEYVWEGPENIFDPSNPNTLASPQNSGTYTLTALRGACTETASFEATVTPIDVEILTEDTLLICRGDALELNTDVTPSDSIPLWTSTQAGFDSLVAPSLTVSPASTATYYAEIALENGCFAIDSVLVRVDSLPASLAIMPMDTSVCQGEIVLLQSPVYEPSDFPGITFEWIPSTGQETPDSLYNMVITAVDTILYQRLTRNGACTDTASAQVNAKKVAEATIMPENPTICPGETVQLLVDITTPYDEFEWTSGAESLSCDDCLNPTTAPLFMSTTFTIEVTRDDCPISVSSSVTVQPLPPYDLQSNAQLCPGESIRLIFNTDDSATYTWTSTDPDFGTVVDGALVVSPTETTTYFLVADNGICPPIEEEVTITIVEAAVLNGIIATETTLCLGEETVLTANIVGDLENDIFQWTGPDGQGVGTSKQIAFSPQVSGTYTLTYISSAECGTQTATIDLEVLPVPIADVTADTLVCLGQSVLLNLATDAATTYTWTSTDPLFSDFNAPAPVVSPAQTATYNLVASNGVCPPIEKEITITIVDPAVLNGIIAPATTLCLGEEALLTANIDGDLENDIFQWTDPDGEEVGTGKQIAFSPQASGTYTLTYISSAECGTQTATIDLEVLPSPVADVIADTLICLGQSVLLNLATDAATTYTWTSTDPLFSDFNAPAPVVSPTQTATYTLVASNGVCDDLEANVTVQVVGNVVLEIIPDALFICRGDTIGITAEAFGGSDQDIFDWSGSDGTTYTGSSIMVLPTEATVYTLNYTSGGGCISLTDSVLIEVEGGLVLNGIRALTDTVSSEFFEGDDLVLVADYTSIFPADELQFIWRLLDGDPGTVVGSGFGLDSLSVELLEAGDLVYQLEIITPDGCSYFADVPVTVKPVTIVAPNTFTPNDDMVNDFFNFLAQTENLDRLEIREFKVYNRWGQLVYDNQTPETGWDGNFNGKPQPSEVYFYLIRVARPNGFELPALQGDVTLVR